MRRKYSTRTKGTIYTLGKPYARTGRLVIINLKVIGVSSWKKKKNEKKISARAGFFLSSVFTVYRTFTEKKKKNNTRNVIFFIPF